MLYVMLVVVVLPFVPVINTVLYPFETVLSIFLSNLIAIFPGKFVPPENKNFDNFIIILDNRIVPKVLILIVYAS